MARVANQQRALHDGVVVCKRILSAFWSSKNSSQCFLEPIGGSGLNIEPLRRQTRVAFPLTG
jgi:hypothetical protein